MPTYEYKREDGSVFEFTQKMSDEALTVCPTSGQKVRRILSGGGGVLYKGDGFYITDYKNKTAGADKSATGDGGQKTGGADKSATGDGGPKTEGSGA